MAEISKKHKELISELEGVSNTMDMILDDEAIVSFPKAFKIIARELDDIIQKLEDGEFEDEEQEAGDEP